MKLNRRFREFLRDEVNPNRNRTNRLYSGIRGVKSHLCDKLVGYQSIDRQGSLSLDTLIKPVRDDDEYDADIQIVMNPHEGWGPKDYLNVVHQTLSLNPDYKDKLELGTRCVTINFAGQFSMDVVPRITEGNVHKVCNGKNGRFEPTDGTGYHHWFHEKSKITNVNLKRAVRLLKYIRDHEKNYKAPSIMLTTLAAVTIQPADRGTERVRTVADTLTTILTRMDSYLQGQPRKPTVRNPVLRSETFDRHWNDTQYEIFRESIHRYAAIASEALACPIISESVDLWVRLFGAEFSRNYKPPQRKNAAQN